MAKRKRRSSGRDELDSTTTSTGSLLDSSSAGSTTAPASSADIRPGTLAWPSPATRIAVSCLIGIHFVGLVVALSANLAPSFLHGKLLAWLAPLHVSTAQDYILQPLELTHAATIDAPLVIEFRSAGEAAWQPLQLQTGVGRSAPLDLTQSRWPNLSRLVSWIAEQQPDSEVLPELAVQALKFADARGNYSDVQEIRFYQPHVLSFDEDLVVAEGQGELISSALTGEVLYAARVVRGPDGEIGLVPEQEPVRTSKPINPSIAAAAAGVSRP